MPLTRMTLAIFLVASCYDKDHEGVLDLKYRNEERERPLQAPYSMFCSSQSTDPKRAAYRDELAALIVQICRGNHNVDDYLQLCPRFGFDGLQIIHCIGEPTPTTL